jgi:hypothetical protein
MVSRKLIREEMLFAIGIGGMFVSTLLIYACAKAILHFMQINF